MLSSACCNHPKTLQPVSHVPAPIQSPGKAPTYAELVNRYNANVAGLNRLWARTDVTMRWITKPRDENDQGDYHKQSGEGKLIVVRGEPKFGLTGPRPGVTITLGALGHTLFWAGANTERYWLFDLRDEGKVYVGRFDRADQLRTQRLPVPVHPSVAPYMLGLMPIETSPGHGTMREVAGYYEIQPQGTNLKYLLDPLTGLPKRVTLLSRTGKPALIAHLAHYQRLERAGRQRQHWPWLATDIAIYPLGREAKLTMSLSGLTDGRSEDRINPAVFNFDALMQAHDPAEVVDLDEPPSP